MPLSASPGSKPAPSRRVWLTQLVPLRVSPRPRALAWWISAAYALIATLWIAYSDSVLEAMVTDPGRLMQLSLYKGMGFVVVTSVLLLLMLRRAFGALQDSYDALAVHDAAVARFSRLYDALSQINQAIVWTTERGELFRRVCTALVERGGFRAAWIGWPEPGTRRLVPTAIVGDDDGALRRMAAQVVPPTVAQGPSNDESSLAEPFVCNDLVDRLEGAPLREDAAQCGLRSSVVLPVRVGGEVRGTLHVYADEAGFFQDKELALLEEAAMDVSFALDNMEREKDRQRAEAALRASELRYRSTLDSMLEGAQILGFDWRYIYLNEAAVRQNRRPNEELLGRSMLDAWPGMEHAPVFRHIERCMLERSHFHVQTEFEFPDGTSGWFDLRGQPVPEGIFLLSIDITERLEAEALLREMNERLEAKVEARTTELQAALVRAEAADHLKSAFLATMSHELRTPLNSILGFTGILLQGLAGSLNAEQSKQLGMVRGSARHLLDLINDVLDLSKIEAGQLQVRADSFELLPSIERVVATVKPLADTKGLTLTARLDPALGQIISDQRRLEQVMLNLLSNAIKFTDRGRVTLSAELRAAGFATSSTTSERVLSVRVEDTGVGIKLEDQGALFQPFSQVDSGFVTQREGTGLGLAICRRLTELLGGEISVESEWTRGTTFTLTLPLERGTNV